MSWRVVLGLMCLSLIPPDTYHSLTTFGALTEGFATRMQGALLSGQQ